MLVLTRRKNQTVHITTAFGERILVSVETIQGNQVRLGFVADPSIAINRSEVLLQKAADRLNTEAKK